MIKTFAPYGSFIAAARAGQHLSESADSTLTTGILPHSREGLMAIALYHPPIDESVPADPEAPLPPSIMDVYLRHNEQVLREYGSAQNLAKRLERLDSDRRSSPDQIQIDVQFDGPPNTPLFFETPLIATLRSDRTAYYLDFDSYRVAVSPASENLPKSREATPEETDQALALLHKAMETHVPASSSENIFDILAVKPVTLSTLDADQIRALREAAQRLQYILFPDGAAARAGEAIPDADGDDAIALIRNEDSGLVEEITVDPNGDLTVTIFIGDPMRIDVWRFDAESPSPRMEPSELTAEECRALAGRLKKRLSFSEEDRVIFGLTEDFLERLARQAE